MQNDPGCQNPPFDLPGTGDAQAFQVGNFWVTVNCDIVDNQHVVEGVIYYFYTLEARAEYPAIGAAGYTSPDYIKRQVRATVKR